MAGGPLTEFREWIETSQQRVAEWQRSIDERLRHLVDGISPFASLQKDVTSLAQRLAEVERKLEKLLADQKSSDTPKE
jgi:hypothetical protein